MSQIRPTLSRNVKLARLSLARRLGHQDGEKAQPQLRDSSSPATPPATDDGLDTLSQSALSDSVEHLVLRRENVVRDAGQQNNIY